MAIYSQMSPDMAKYGQIWTIWPDVAKYDQIYPDMAIYGQIRPDIDDMARYSDKDV